VPPCRTVDKSRGSRSCFGEMSKKLSRCTNLLQGNQRIPPNPRRTARKVLQWTGGGTLGTLLETTWANPWGFLSVTALGSQWVPLCRTVDKSRGSRSCFGEMSKKLSRCTNLLQVIQRIPPNPRRTARKVLQGTVWGTYLVPMFVPLLVQCTMRPQ
jgi:hypothetical protein